MSRELSIRSKRTVVELQQLAEYVFTFLLVLCPALVLQVQIFSMHKEEAKLNGNVVTVHDMKTCGENVH
jgi:hypothetical protein